ncbi:MAG: T9SS C-terminal target domain-containing protein [Ignavibacteriae bacterium]|nr:MAG: T9SS C-terminal target domain-containing protein [Ignavibacteriota bacterium]
MRITTKLLSLINLLLNLSIFLLAFNSISLLCQDEEEDIQNKRWKKFYIERMYPYDSISTNSFVNAIQERNNSLNRGYFLSNEQWYCLGPDPVNDVEITGIGSGRVSSVCFDKQNPEIIYAGGACGGLWKRNLGYTFWYPKTDFLENLSSGALAMDSLNNILYYGTGEAVWFGPSYPGYGIYKSVNCGESWTKLQGDGLPLRTYFFRIAINPVHPDTIFAAMKTGLYRTTNGGTRWYRIIPNEERDEQCTDVVMSPDGMNVYAVGSGNFFPQAKYNGIGYKKSTDGGFTFQTMTGTGFPHISDPPYPHGRTCITLCQSKPNVLYIISYFGFDTTINTVNYSNPYYVYKSTNYGESFTVVKGGIPVTDGGANAGYNMMIKVSPYHPDTLFVGGCNLYRSTNGGSSFTAIGGYVGNDEIHPDFHNLEFYPNSDYPDKIITGCDGGVYFSTNLGENWNNLNGNGIVLTQMYRIGSAETNVNKMFGGAQDYGVLTKYDNSEWILSGTMLLGGDGGSVVFNKDKLLVSNRDKIIHTSNLGSNWALSSGWSGSIGGLVCLTAHPKKENVFELVVNDTNTIGLFNIFRSENYGASFSPYSSIQHSEFIDLMPINLSISSKDTSIVYLTAGHRIEFYDKANIVFRSTDGGQNWSTLPIAKGGLNGIPNRFFSKVEADPFNENDVVLTLSGYDTSHVYKSTNKGSNWFDITGNLPDNPVSDIVIHYTDCTTKEYIVATDVGVYRSDASGINWTLLASGLPNCPAIDLDYNRISNQINVSLFGRGVWGVNLNSAIVVKDSLCIRENTYNINGDIIVCPGGKLSILDGCTLRFAAGKKIIVTDGGYLYINSSAQQPVVLTGQSGSWFGIEFQNRGYGGINYCNFISATPSIFIYNSSVYTPLKTTINNCNLYTKIIINSRDSVQICNNNWISSSNCISAVYSSKLYIANNTFVHDGFNDDSSAISLSSVHYSTISNNNITNFNPGILISNSEVNLEENKLIHDNTSNTATGIAMDFGYYSSLSGDSILGYKNGIKLYNSTPILYNTTIINNNEDNDPVAIYCENYSYPRLSPAVQGGEYIWDGGKNNLLDGGYTNNQSTAFGVLNSLPNVNYGWNKIFANQWYLYDNGPGGVDPILWEAQCNSWFDGEPSMERISGNYNVLWVEYNCDPPDANIIKEDNENSFSAGGALIEDPLPPPEPIIINLGNGHYDTIKVTTCNITVSADKQLYFEGVKKELLTNYTQALPLFQQVIQNYQDSLTAIYSLKRILTSTDKLVSIGTLDTSAYSSLRSYFNGLAVNNSTDTAFYNVSSELAAKCLVRLKHYTHAIEEYENMIANTTDSSKIKGCQLNIIEIYMLMSTGGDAPSYTGRIQVLKPNSVEDGFRMIRELMVGKSNAKSSNVIPKEYALSQNYPNPFNPLTKINYALPQGVKVSIKVYDILGRLVKELVNEYKDAGNYTITFDGTNYASGVYFYRIEAGTFSAVKKMVIVK